MFKIQVKVKDHPYLGTYFKVEGRYYKIHAVDKKAKYLHMYGDEYSSHQIGEQFGTTIDGWERRVEEGKYIILDKSEVPERILNYQVKKKYEF